MKSSAKKVELASVDDLFSTEESRADAQRERVMEIPLSELHPFKNHPFKVKDDEAISPYGLPMAAIWLLGKAQDLKFTIRDLVYR